jgi:hypothetical protein
LACYEHALAVGDPGDTFPLVNLLATAAVLGDEAALEEALHSLPDGMRRCVAQIAEGVNVPWCYYDLGTILFFEGRQTESEQHIRAAVERSAPWQVAAARFTFERLAETKRFGGRARAVLAGLAP